MADTHMPMTIEVQEHDDHAVILPTGYLNALTGDQIDKVCSSLIDKGTRYFIVNFGRVELINTIGISILVGLVEKVLSRQGLVYFTELGGTKLQIFEALNLNTVVMIFPNDDAAREHLQRDREAVERAEAQ